MLRSCILSCIFFLLSAAFAEARSTLAESLFQKFSSSIYQIESISKQSDKKNSIGSGFQISMQGFIVTNYHVVSDAVLYPETFEIRTIASDKRSQPAKVVHIDVVHDLAILQVSEPGATALPLGQSAIKNGNKLFSIGNPEDVGMMIIEGVANGYMEKALYQKVLTSLALNPGMSGGPALNESGEVIGVNVMTAGNSLSFLVPVEFLKELWFKVKAAGFSGIQNFDAEIKDQLSAQEHSYFKDLIAAPWEAQTFGLFKVPTAIANEVSCWGAPGDNPEFWITAPYLSCAIRDNLYISSTLSAHTISFNYITLKSRTFDPFRFTNLAQQRFTNGYRFDLGQVDERDAGNFKCRTDLIIIAGRPFWVSSCTRPLKRLDGLFDFNMRMASLGSLDSMLMVEVTLGAMTENTIKNFISKFNRTFQ